MTAPDRLPEVMTPGQVAAVFAVDAKTVTRWAKSGRLPSFTTIGGHRRYRGADVAELIRATQPSS